MNASIEYHLLTLVYYQLKDYGEQTSLEIFSPNNQSSDKRRPTSFVIVQGNDYQMMLVDNEEPSQDNQKVHTYLDRGASE